MLKNKKHNTQKDWLLAWEAQKRFAETEQGKQRVEYLINLAISRIPKGKCVYTWSGGKDAIALQCICERVGITECALGTIGLQWEYPSFVKYIEKNISDKSFGDGSGAIKCNGAAEPRKAYFMGYEFVEGESYMGFNIVSVSENGEIVLERKKHAMLDVSKFILDNPWCQALIGPLAKPWAKIAQSEYEGVNQKIVIQTRPGGTDSGHFNTLSDFDGEASGYIQKITYTEEGENYASTIEVTRLEGAAEIGGGSIKDNPDWLDPSTFMKGEAGVTGCKVTGNIRRGSEENNVNIGKSFFRFGKFNSGNGYEFVCFRNHKGFYFVFQKNFNKFFCAWKNIFPCKIRKNKCFRFSF